VSGTNQQRDNRTLDSHKISSSTDHARPFLLDTPSFTNTCSIHLLDASSIALVGGRLHDDGVDVDDVDVAVDNNGFDDVVDRRSTRVAVCF
jgi:hypothetical protein